LALVLFSSANSWNDYALPFIPLQTDARRRLPTLGASSLQMNSFAAHQPQ